ncbi:transmembrane protein 140 isoform X1 [Sarcophilus harrisii]|uniref:Transmembrane protein 140 n=2 Tax=Sarcophilus harrisii TaxID=9305 RepID=A0A7N4V6N6_SARHA|nr:transmembrane protein 140 isoform X1 [Sarcophilus harrisii]
MNPVMSSGKLLLSKVGEGIKMVTVKSKGRRILLSLTTIILLTTVISLLLYALLWRSGNLIDLPTIKIGFYNFCLWNESSHFLQCHQFPELERLRVSQIGIALARFGVYGALVIALFAALPFLLAWFYGNKDKWNLSVVLLGASAGMLLGGLLLFLFYIAQWIQPSKLGAEFLALVGAEIMLLLLLLIIVMYPLGYGRSKLEPQGTKTYIYRESSPTSVASLKIDINPQKFSKDHWGCERDIPVHLPFSP